ASIPVRRRPSLALLATGDELVAPGTTPAAGQIVYSNGFALAALARREGAQVIDLGIVPDRVDATIAAIDRATLAPADILVTTGGAGGAWLRPAGQRRARRLLARDVRPGGRRPLGRDPLRRAGQLDGCGACSRRRPGDPRAARCGGARRRTVHNR